MPRFLNTKSKIDIITISVEINPAKRKYLLNRSSYIWSNLAHFPTPNLKMFSWKKFLILFPKPHFENISSAFSKKFFLIFQEMELSIQKNRKFFSKKSCLYFGKWNFITFSQKKFSLCFEKWNFLDPSLRNFSCFRRKFSGSKNKKNPTLKMFLHFLEMNFLVPSF